MKFGMLMAALMTMGFAIHANAQSMWGTGVAGGQQSCPYNVQLGDGAQSDLDDIKAAQDTINDLNKQLAAAKRDKTKADRAAKGAEKDIRNVIEDDHADFIIDHMDNSRKCSEYVGSTAQAGPTASGNTVDGDGNETPISTTPNVEIKSFGKAEWNSFCDPQTPGTVFPAICNDPKAQQADQDDDNRKDVGACKDGIKVYRKASADSRKLQRKIKSLTDQITSAKDSMKDAKQAMIDDMKSDTEGGICVDCMANNSGYAYQQQNRSTDWASVAGNVATGLLGMYAGYEQNRQNNKMVAQYNSNLGFPTQPVPASYASIGYGLPYIQAGLYGAMGGGQGQGAMGCGSSGSQMGGAFGYPAGMYNPMMGGGMYGNGMMMGGMSGMMMGGMQMGMMAAGYQMGMMMNGGMMTNSGMMIPGMGMMGGGGYPMNGMMSSGMMAGMQMGMMTGMMMNAGMMSGGGYPMGMMSSGMMAGMQMGMMSGMMMSGGLMSSGMMAGGYPMSGMMSSGMMAGGMPMAGMMMSGGLMTSGMQMGMMSGGYMSSGLMSSGMMMDASMASLQQQMYQQQMATYQSYMQQQAQKQQVTAGLQQELYGLLYRIQQVQSGVGLSTTGSYLGSTVNSGGINGGTITGGSITNGTTTVPYVNGTTATTPLGSGR